MNTLAQLFVGLVAAIQIYILILEMFLWTGPKGQKAFGMTAEFAKQTKVLAANQGLYNGFLAAGLIWGLLTTSEPMAFYIKVFFLTCVLVAGLYGAATASRKILWIQALPAAIALVLLHLR